MVDETRQIQVLFGPYRDHRLTVSSADADAAISNHWAVDPFAAPAAPDEEPHPPLTDEERTAALEAATTWAQAQWDAAQAIGQPREPPPEGTPVRRDMKPDDTSGRYPTRSIPDKPKPDETHDDRRKR
jgi:hypothetical protein